MALNLNPKTLLAIILSLVALLTASKPVFSRQPGEPGKVALRVTELQQSNTRFRETSLFTLSTESSREAISNTLKKYTLLSLNQTNINTLLQTKPEFIRVFVPVNGGSQIPLLLYKVSISGNGFTLLTSEGRTYNELNPIVHYRGIIENNLNSVVSFSFSTEETMGLICNDEGNIVLGEIENTTGGEYVLYNDKDLIPPFVFSCGTNTSNPAKDYQQQQPNNQLPGTLTVNCV